MPTSSIVVEANFTGAGWEAITGDVVQSAGIRIKRGITSGKLDDRVADPGTLTFALNNSASNSGGLVGYYTPGHADCRSGFAAGLLVRLRVTSGATTQTKFYGHVIEGGIQPVPGTYGERRTYVTVCDWMDYAAETPLGNIPYTENRDIATVVETIMYYMPEVPVSEALQTGYTRYDAIYDPTAGNLKGLTEFVRAANSELGWVYIRITSAHDEVIVTENRYARDTAMIADDPLYEFDNDMSGGDIVAKDDWGGVIIKTHPRREDTSPVVLYSSPQYIFVEAGDTLEITGRYRDPENEDVYVSARSTEELLRTIDYLMASKQDGTGTDLTDDLAVTVSAGANSAVFTLENTGSTDGWIYLQIRGRGIYLYPPVEVESASATMPYLYIDARYQDDVAEARRLARWLYAKVDAAPDMVWKSIVFYPNRTSDLMTAFLTGDIGDHIRITEAVSGAVDQDYFINGIEAEILGGGNIRCTWHVMWDIAPAAAYFTVDTSELDGADILAP